MQSTRDSVVIAEWSRRKGDYVSRSRWLRIPFYSSVALSLVGFWLLPSAWGIAIVVVSATALLVVGVLLSKYSYSSLKCPHCEDRPFNLYNTRISWDHCRKCGYWLVDLPGAA
jgi:hypothetical protein